MDCSPPGFSVHGIFQAKIPEWIAMPSSKGSSWPRDWTPAISWSLLKFMSFESVMPSNHLIFICPLLLLPSVYPSVSLFPRVGSLHSMTKVNRSPSNEYSVLIFLRIDWFDLLAGNGMCKLGAPGKTAYFLWWCLTPNCSDNIPVYNLKKVSWSPFFTYE